MDKIFYVSVVLSWLMVIVACSPVEPNQGTVVREVAKISVDNAIIQSDYYHKIMAVDGDTAVVSSLLNNNKGSIYIYTRNGNNWIQQTNIRVNNSISTRFGTSVAIDGDYLVVGAAFKSLGSLPDNPPEGKAYVFVRNGDGNWVLQATLKSSDTEYGTSDTEFGTSVAIDGDTVIVGTPDYGRSWFDARGFGYYTAPGVGTAHVYTRSGSNWTEQAKIKPNDNIFSGYRYFGSSVAIDGNTVIVGAYGGAAFSIGTAAGTTRYSIKGYAYIFTREGNDWSQQAILEDTNSLFVDRFGWSVAIDGDYAIVGSYNQGTSGREYLSGAAYIFNRDGDNWTQQAKIKANDFSAKDRFGWSVAINGDTAIVGAVEDDDNGSENGSSYMFTRSGTTWSQSSKILANDIGVGSEERFGRSVAIQGNTAIVSGGSLTYIYQINR